MIVKVKKSDGCLDTFDIEKIADDILKSMPLADAENYDEALELAGKAVDKLISMNISVPDTEQIQNEVEKVLIENGKTDAAVNYIHSHIDKKHFKSINCGLIDEYEAVAYGSANALSVSKKLYACGKAARTAFNKEYVISPEFSESVDCGDIFINSSETYGFSVEAVSLSLKKLFDGGFSFGSCSFRIPNRMGTYASLACTAVEAMYSDGCKNVVISEFDKDMADGVKKTFRHLYRDNIAKGISLFTGRTDCKQLVKNVADKLENEGLLLSFEGISAYADAEAQLLLQTCDAQCVEAIQSFAYQTSVKETDREVYQAMEAFIHSLSSVSDLYSDGKCTVCFGLDTSVEGRMVIKNILLAGESGLGKGETPASPSFVFRLAKKSNDMNSANSSLEIPNYDLFRLACRVVGKRGFPNFEFVSSDSDKAYSVDGIEIGLDGGLCLAQTIINLPCIALKSHGSRTMFFSLLDETLDLCIKQLASQYEVMKTLTADDLPFMIGQNILKSSDRDEDMFKYGSLDVGFSGLAQCLCVLANDVSFKDMKAQQLGIQIVSHMKTVVEMKACELKMNFRLSGTDNEECRQQFAELDRERFGSIKGFTDCDAYSSSYHADSGCKLTTNERISLEAPYCKLVSGQMFKTAISVPAGTLLSSCEKLVNTLNVGNIGYASVEVRQEEKVQTEV